MESAGIPMFSSSSSSNFSAAASVWMNVHFRRKTHHSGPTTTILRRSRDFPLNVQHPLHHDGDTQRGFSSVRLTLRDFTFFPHSSRSNTFKNPLDFPAVSVFFSVFLLTGLTVSSLLCKLKYFFSNFSLVKKSLIHTKWFWKLPYFLLNKKLPRLKSKKINLTSKWHTKWSRM